MSARVLLDNLLYQNAVCSILKWRKPAVTYQSSVSDKHGRVYIIDLCLVAWQNAAKFS